LQVCPYGRWNGQVYRVHNQPGSIHHLGWLPVPRHKLFLRAQFSRQTATAWSASFRPVDHSARVLLISVYRPVLSFPSEGARVTLPTRPRRCWTGQVYRVLYQPATSTMQHLRRPPGTRLT
ncbi:MAG: hypothetical protein ACK559_12155, partial [bacterium]